jgi:phosphoribosylformimino-5-aminoimidazole carboxamide ribotide isomerase
VRIPIIASGGLHNLADVEALCAVQDEGIEGVICGRSIYEGTINLNEAQLRADELSGELSDSSEE